MTSPRLLSPLSHLSCHPLLWAVAPTQLTSEGSRWEGLLPQANLSTCGQIRLVCTTATSWSHLFPWSALKCLKLTPPPLSSGPWQPGDRGIGVRQEQFPEEPQQSMSFTHTTENTEVPLFLKKTDWLFCIHDNKEAPGMLWKVSSSSCSGHPNHASLKVSQLISDGPIQPKVSPSATDTKLPSLRSTSPYTLLALKGQQFLNSMLYDHLSALLRATVSYKNRSSLLEEVIHLVLFLIQSSSLFHDHLHAFAHKICSLCWVYSSLQDQTSISFSLPIF